MEFELVKFFREMGSFRPPEEIMKDFLKDLRKCTRTLEMWTKSRFLNQKYCKKDVQEVKEHLRNCLTCRLLSQLMAIKSKLPKKIIKVLPRTEGESKEKWKERLKSLVTADSALYARWQFVLQYLGVIDFKERMEAIERWEQSLSSR